MRLCVVLAFLFACPTIYCQRLQQPLTQLEACRKFEPSVVQIDTAAMHGTGFIVGSDGWILTALHVVADRKTLIKYGNISVIMRGYSHSFPAEIASPLDDLARARDFAVLKIDKTGLPALELGNETTVEDGSPIAIIGFPLSAMLPPAAATLPMPRFCLTGTIAAQSALPLGNLEYLHIVYFQGVSIKGISGAPVISIQTGKVIGVVSTKLTGIDAALDDIRKNAAPSGGLDIRMRQPDGNFFGIGGSFSTIIDVLDNQLANGLGSGTGASDAAYALKKVQRDYKRHHPAK